MSSATVSAPGGPGLESDSDPPEPEPVWLFATEASMEHISRIPMLLADNKPVEATVRVTHTHLELASAPASSGPEVAMVNDPKVS